MTPFT